MNIITLAHTPAPVTPSTAQNIFDGVLSLFGSLDMLAQPDALVRNLQMLSIVWAVVFLAVGMMCMFSGARYYRGVTIATAFLVGLFLGYWLGDKIGSPFVVAGSLALVMAVAVCPVMKYAVAFFGALTGAFVGANLWSGFAHALATAGVLEIQADNYWVGALIGLIVCGMLAFVLFDFSVAMYTSVSGATITTLGVLCLLLSFEPWRPTLHEGLTGSQLVIPLLVFVPALIGLILQNGWKGSEAGAGEDK